MREKKRDGFECRQHGKKEGASFQVVILGSSGGPREDTITGMLVRAPQSEWRKSSVIAVDAGAHLASIVKILEHDMPYNSDKIAPPDHFRILENGPFAGVRFPNISAKANALFFFRELLHSFLITHPHLDHLSALGINTPALEYGREAKAIVALPPTIEAIKNHIFNDSIWPNLSDEGHGVGFVTYRRLIEGGNPRLGYGEARGYVNVCDGLATKCWSVSHGKCHRHVQHHSAHHRGESFAWSPNEYNFPPRKMSRISDDHGYFAAIAAQQAQNNPYGSIASHLGMPPGPRTPGDGIMSAGAMSVADKDHLFEPVTSSAFFIRNDVTGHELLVFGDIEPDSVSMSPRNHIVWDDAAPKIAQGKLNAMFIECSYDDSVRNEDLYGHLCPRHLIAELTFLAKRVMSFKKKTATDLQNQALAPTNFLPTAMDISLGFPSTKKVVINEPPTAIDLKRKRKRNINGDLPSTPELPTLALGSMSPASPAPGSPMLDGPSNTHATRSRTACAVSPHGTTILATEVQQNLGCTHHPQHHTSSVSFSSIPEQNLASPTVGSAPRAITPQPQVQQQTALPPLNILTHHNSVGAIAAVAAQMGAGHQHNRTASGTSMPPNIAYPATSAPQPNNSLQGSTVLAPQSSTNLVPQPTSKEKMPDPLQGLTVHIIHVKDTLSDGPTPGEIILQQLIAGAADVGLGCEFDVTSCGESIWV